MLSVSTLFFKNEGVLAIILLLSVPHYNCKPNDNTIKPDDCSSKSLVLVNCIFRHGNRTRDTHEGFPKNQYNNESAWMPLGFGQLTAAGRNTEYQLGRFLRRRYDNFLPRTYFYKDISVFSSNIYRTMESAQLVCAGLYSPPLDYNQWGKGDELGYKWQPIPVQTMPQDDLWIQGHASCPPYDRELEEVLNKQFAKDNNENKDLYTLLSTNTGENVTTVKDVAKVYNTLKNDEENGKTLPDWATKELMAKLDPFRLRGFQVRSHTKLMKEIKAGPMFNLLSVNVKNKTCGELNPDNKMILYSGHDTTLVAVINSLGATTMWDPQYGACLLIELHKIEEKYVVKVLYLKSGLDQNLETVTLQDWNNDAPIPLDVFNKILDGYQVTTKDWYKKCEREQCIP